jgi:hypothetical protein
MFSLEAGDRTQGRRPAMVESRGSKETTDPELSKGLEVVANALRSLRFGQVTVIVQDGVIVQIERTERTRMRRASGK